MKILLSKHGKYAGVNVWFDREELTEIGVRIMLCIQHREFHCEFALLGLSLDAWANDGSPAASPPEETPPAVTEPPK